MDKQPITDARAQLSVLANQVHYGRASVGLTSRGKPQAALVPWELAEAAEAVGGPDAATEILRNAAPVTSYWLIALDKDHRRDLENAPEWDGPEDEGVWGLYRRHETGGGDGDGWDEQIKGGLTKPGAEQLADQMGLNPNSRLGD